MWTCVIPWPWRALAVCLLCIASGLVGWWDGATHEGVRALQRDNAALRETEQTVTRLQQAARETERRHAQAMADVSSDYQRRIDEAHQLRAADRVALRTGALRLRDPGTPGAGGGSAAGSPGAGSPGRDGGTAGELSRQAAEFLLELASDADDVARQLAACQRIVREDRHLF